MTFNNNIIATMFIRRPSIRTDNNYHYNFITFYQFYFGIISCFAPQRQAKLVDPMSTAYERSTDWVVGVTDVSDQPIEDKTLVKV